jgi:DNA gyrase subunit A
MGRATQGVTLISVDDGTTLSGLQRVVESDAQVDAADDAEPPAGDAPGLDQPGEP